MPPCLIKDQHGMGPRRDVEGDLFEMQTHGLAVAPGHDDSCTFAFSRADGTKDIGRCGPLIFGG